MDISVKRIEIDRHGEEGLICKDNIRADIKVAFFVRVNKTDARRAAGGPVARLRSGLRKRARWSNCSTPSSPKP